LRRPGLKGLRESRFRDVRLEILANPSEATEARAYTSWVHVERAELPRVVGDEVGRQRELREAHRLFTAMGATARAEQVARELGSSVESTSEISSTSRT